MNNNLNEIPDRQNDDKFIKFLTASSQTYSQVKTLSGAQAILSLPIPILLSIIAILFPQYRVWAAFYGIVISLVNMVLFEKIQNGWKKDAAKIQEIFDCDLLELDWNEIKVGDRPAPERIESAATKYIKKHPDLSALKDWYSLKVGKLPLYLARIVCQRSNIWWDIDLREKYVTSLTIMISFVTILAFASGIFFKMSLEAFILSILITIFPAIQWSIREIKAQRTSIETLTRLVKYAQELWDKTLDKRITEVQIKEKSRNLQDELFSHRYTNQPIFNWIYNRFKKEMNQDMNVGAEELVEKALQTLKPNKKQ